MVLTLDEIMCSVAVEVEAEDLDRCGEVFARGMAGTERQRGPGNRLFEAPSNLFLRLSSGRVL